MVELIAALVDRLRTVSLHRWVMLAVIAVGGAALVVCCSVGTNATLAGVMPGAAAVLLALTLIWPESLASFGFLALTLLWWLFGWQGSAWVTVPVACLVGLVHLLTALVTGPPHAVVRGRLLRRLAVPLGAYLVVTLACAAAVVALTALPGVRALSWVALVVVCVGTIAASLVAGATDEAGTVTDEVPDDEPYVPESLR